MATGEIGSRRFAISGCAKGSHNQLSLLSTGMMRSRIIRADVRQSRQGADISTRGSRLRGLSCADISKSVGMCSGISWKAEE